MAALTRAVWDFQRTIAPLNAVHAHSRTQQLSPAAVASAVAPAASSLVPPQAAEVTKVASASASIETAEVIKVAAASAPARTGAIRVTKVAAAPAPTDAAKVTKVAAAPGLTDVAGLLRQQVPNRRSFPSSAKPLYRACERYPLPPDMSKPKSRHRASMASSRLPYFQC